MRKWEGENVPEEEGKDGDSSLHKDMGVKNIRESHNMLEALCIQVRNNRAIMWKSGITMEVDGSEEQSSVGWVSTVVYHNKGLRSMSIQGFLIHHRTTALRFLQWCFVTRQEFPCPFKSPTPVLWIQRG
jgi:hypothetical protein